MEMEYKDTRRRGKVIIGLGVVLALAAGGAAFYLISQAQQAAGQAGLQKVSVVVAVRPIPARKLIEAEDVTVREVPIDNTNAQGIVSTPDKVIGQVPAVTILQDQMVTTNLLAAGSTGGKFAILGPTETVGPDSEAWRAVSLTVPGANAVGGMIEAGETVDVIATATVLVPQSLLDEGRYYVDKASKVTYQNMVILARAGDGYILRANLQIAEEIAHLQATGNVQFSMVLRPIQDTRIADASKLGATTNRFLERYGLPIPEVYPPGDGPVPTLPPQPTPSPSPTPSEAATPSPSAP